MIEVLLFASLKEAVAQPSLQLELSLPVQVLEIKAAAASVAPLFAQLAQDGLLNVAVNQNIVGDSYWIQPGDEVAMFPPVTGG